MAPITAKFLATLRIFIYFYRCGAKPQVPRSEKIWIDYEKSGSAYELALPLYKGLCCSDYSISGTASLE